jgi:hypothetical protein
VAAITHPWESGRDNCADWDPGMANVDGSGVGEYTRRDTGHVDASMRPSKEDYDRYLAILQFGRACGWDQAEIVANGPFYMADPAMTFILIRAHSDLAAMGRSWARMSPRSRAGRMRSSPVCRRSGTPRSAPTTRATCAPAPSPGASGRARSSPGWPGIENAEMEARLKAVWDGVRYGIPSNDPAAENFNPRRYWRGPTWPVVNSLIAMGFASAGRTAEAAAAQAKRWS